MVNTTIDLLDGRLKVRHLVLIAAVAERGSLLRAAEHLRVAQPAATRALREVEAILGVELFVRGPRGTTPTAYGEAFLDHARAVLTELRRAAERVGDLARGEAGTVRVGTLLTGSDTLLPRAIASLKRERPGITVAVHEATFDAQVPKLLDGEIDLVVGRLNPVPPGAPLRQIPLYDEAIRLVTRPQHPAQGRASLSLADLTGYPWILPLAPTALRHELDHVFAAAGIPAPADVVECTSILTVRALLHDTDAIAAMPELVAAGDPGLAPLPVPLPSIRRSVGVTLGAHAPLTPPTEQLLTHLRQRAADLRPRTMPAML